MARSGTLFVDILLSGFFFRSLVRPENMDDFLDKGMDALSSLFEDDLERETARV